LSKKGEKEWLLLERVLGDGKKLWKQARLATERKVWGFECFGFCLHSERFSAETGGFQKQLNRTVKLPGVGIKRVDMAAEKRDFGMRLSLVGIFILSVLFTRVLLVTFKLITWSLHAD